MFFKIICIFSTVLICSAGSDVEVAVNSSWFDFWFFRLLFNLLGYATIAVPAYIIIRYLRKINYNDKGD